MSRVSSCSLDLSILVYTSEVFSSSEETMIYRPYIRIMGREMDGSSRGAMVSQRSQPH